MTKLIISSSVFQSQVADLLPCNGYKKSQLTYSLLQAYNLLQYFDVVIDKPYCSKEDLLRFHSAIYVDQLMKGTLNAVQDYDKSEDDWDQLNETSEHWYDSGDKFRSEKRFHSREDLYEHFKTIEFDQNIKNDSYDNIRLTKRMKLESVTLSNDELLKTFNLTGDCPLFSYLPMYIQVSTGATLALENHINLPSPDQNNSERIIGINWDGGRHHASKQRASGFCYVNDIVLLIQRLRKKGFQRISYVDFDLHHGDGVENAFKYSNFIQTISLHLYEAGFFPGTGDLKNNKSPNLVNIPMLHGLNDTYLRTIVDKIIIPLIDQHDPQIIVIQSGGDGLSGDKYNEWQLSIHGLTKCILELIERFTKCHCVVLGGGGYNELIMSRFNTFLTWNIVRKYSSKVQDRLIKEYIEDGFDYLIPDHEFIDLYTDDNYKYWSYEEPGNDKCKTLRNYNTPKHLEECFTKIFPKKSPPQESVMPPPP
ncbi:similar to Saccharomyces cerevisiae YPR068C HOS1 Class I histone deacetylase (HDAC) family member that deacetylates Smc3p on lysine residues at anaphase onset [Maudiozyma saulgeensis]|uniref:histone deacetylase n=1 Tax=Maudiozyma saulgeensis TaxID=1789683 RepID=A0A1X7QXH2_9SACH|nr:similar to Saccharomyces cerevisiae YPR068C HOS1 Class I histone deacetylase (HDAC) family member that deacetylates Smc3p on lysine residues at anaphase onset [Kazachstania saulgeensis]